MKKIKKSTLIFAAVFVMVFGTFTTSMAAKFSFTINRGLTVKSSTVQKTGKSYFGTVTITKASATGYKTDFVIVNYNNLKMTETKAVKNSYRGTTKLAYFDANVLASRMTRLRGIDSRMTAPNGSTVSGSWTPMGK